jgi:hypothetical protein
MARACINEDFETLEFSTGEKVTLQYQYRDANNNPIDITGQAFRFGAKKTNESVGFEIGPVDGDLDDPVNGLFSFTFTVGADDFDGVYEIAQNPGTPDKSILTPAGGVDIKVKQALID